MVQEVLQCDNQQERPMGQHADLFDDAGDRPAANTPARTYAPSLDAEIEAIEATLFQKDGSRNEAAEQRLARLVHLRELGVRLSASRRAETAEQRAAKLQAVKDRVAAAPPEYRANAEARRAEFFEAAAAAKAEAARADAERAEMERPANNFDAEVLPWRRGQQSPSEDSE
jgi:hypothetical protein